MKKIFISFYGLLFLLFVNSVFADNNFKESIEKNKKQYDDMILKEYIYLKNQSDKDLFEPALKRCKYFAEKYFSERDKQEIIRDKIKKELLNDEKWEEYLFEVIHRLEIQSLVLSEKIVKDAGHGFDNRNQMVEFYDNVDGKNIKKELSLDKVVKDIYERMGRKGANDVPSNEVQRLFEKYCSKYKNTLLNVKYFSMLLAALSPKIGINSLGTVILGVTSVIADFLCNYIDDKINDYRIHLRNAVFKAEEKFHTILNKLVIDELEKVIEYYKNVELEKLFLP